MKRLSLLAAVLTLSGCVGQSAVNNASDEAFYTLDTRYFHLCRGSSRTCLDLTYIVSMRTQLGPIETMYGRRIKGPNYPLDLTQMLISPPDGSYASSVLDGEGRFRRLPANAHTNKVWQTLDNGIGGLYR